LFTIHIDFHVEAVGRGFDAVAGEELAEIFVIHFRSALGLAEGETVVFYREEGFLGGHFVYFELDAVVVWISFRFASCERERERERWERRGWRGASNDEND